MERIKDPERVLKLMREGFSLTVYENMRDIATKSPRTISMHRYSPLGHFYVHSDAVRKLLRDGKIRKISGRKQRNMPGGTSYEPVPA